MWTTMLIAVVAVSAGGDVAATVSGAADSACVRCVEAALPKIPPRRVVTLVCRDGSQARGMILGYDASRGQIQVLPERARSGGHPGAWSSLGDAPWEARMVQTADVTHLAWTERGGSAIPRAVVGLLFGTLVGAIGGAAAAPDQQGFLDFTPVAYVLGGSAIGGALGLTLGVILPLGSHSHVVNCLGRGR